MAPRAAENLRLLDDETDRLLVTARTLVPADLTSPTLSSGWDVAHVLTHVARNADALLNLVRYAVDGTPREAYPSEAARAADIEAGARRALREIVADVEASAARFRTEAGALTGPAGDAEVRTRVGTTVTGAQLVSMRVLEVVFHHADLDKGYGFGDADPGWVARTLRSGARRWAVATDAPRVVLVPDGLNPIPLGETTAESTTDLPTVSGSPAQLLLWLGRGVASGLRSDLPQLPVPPPWA